MAKKSGFWQRCSAIAGFTQAADTIESWWSSAMGRSSLDIVDAGLDHVSLGLFLGFYSQERSGSAACYSSP